MKLYDLIKSNNWLSVEIILLQLYPDQKAMSDEYRNVFEKLKLLEPEESDMTIVLTEYDSDTDDESEIETYVDVSGRKTEKDKNVLTDSYAIEFVEWKKWLGMNLATETTNNFNELEIIAHCLYEMTFCGFNEEEIKEQFDTINDSIEEYKNMTEEEKNENTITLDELIRRIDEGDNSEQPFAESGSDV
jgi:hypothetical protein